MNRTNWKPARPMFSSIAAISLCLGLSACGDGNDDDDDDFIAMPTPSPSPSPTPSPTPTGIDVSQCLNQTIPGTGVTVAEAVIPDVLTIDPSKPAGFPNGRLLSDPVIDVTLAVIFLDLDSSGQSALSFAKLPLNPPSNDVAFRTSFPFLAPPQGSPPIASGAGSNFNFRTDSLGDYVRVDRMGMPAISTALIPSDTKTAYNDANPTDDAEGEFVPEITNTLTALTEGIGDDLTDLGFDICAD